MALRIGTRRSPLAMAQSRLVADALRAAHAGLDFTLVPVVTRGDRTPGPLREAGGKGLFTAELEARLRRGELDLAVHSAKDLPVDMADDLAIAATPRAGDARDALVSAAGPLAQLPAGATIGTNSLRRRAQLLAMRHDVVIVSVRGNVDTRVAGLLSPPAGQERLDALVLALAGLVRSGLAEKHRGRVFPFGPAERTPAAGQGVLAVQIARANDEAAEIAAAIDDPGTHVRLLAERRVLAAVGADCHTCIAVHVARAAGEWRGLAMIARPDGTALRRLSESAADPEAVADALIAGLRREIEGHWA